jgi:alpha-beta hydrolase superfamily lysophospholipase
MRTVEKSRCFQAPQAVYLHVGSAFLDGELLVPAGARGLVMFVHGGGSSRHSPHDRAIAAKLHDEFFATFLFDLLTCEEEAKDIQTGEYRHNVDLLANRLAEITDTLKRDPLVRSLPFAYVATGTGAAAALAAAAEQPSRCEAIILRNGRPDLPHSVFGQVHTPTLLIVGNNDPAILKQNQEAFEFLRCEKKLQIISCADQRFEQPGTFQQMEKMTADWLARHLRAELVCA